MKTLITLTVTVLLCLAASKSSAWTVGVQVTDADGVAVSDANVTLLGSATCPTNTVTMQLSGLTDRYGAVTVSEVPSGCFQVEVNHPTLGTVRERLGLVQADIIGLPLALPGYMSGFNGCTINGRVLDRNQQPVAGAHVLLIDISDDSSPSNQSRIVHSNEQGLFAFDHILASTCDIHAIDGLSRVTFRWEDYQETGAPHELILPEEVEGRRMLTISGTVYDATGSGTTDAHVVLLGSLGEDANQQIGLVTHSAESGAFTLNAIAGATYVAHAFGAGLGMADMPLGRVEQDLTNSRLNLPGAIWKIGEAEMALNPIRIDFHDVVRGTYKKVSVTITNLSGAEMAFSTQNIQPPGGGCNSPQCLPGLLPFYISTGGGNFSLEPGEDHVTTIACYSFNFGPQDAVFHLMVASPSEYDLEVPLSAFTLGIRPESDIKPNEFGIAGVYPNPFNSSANIVINLENPSNVTLQILDNFGRTVGALIDGEEISGVHSSVWDAGKLPGGIYYARLRAGELVSIKRVVLLR